jgi:hypothetical protein
LVTWSAFLASQCASLEALDNKMHWNMNEIERRTYKNWSIDGWITTVCGLPS